MKKTILFLTCFLTSLFVYPQITFQKTFEGDSSLTFGQDLKQTSDGGYILVGTTDSYGAGDRDIYVIKMNNAGDTIWTKTYGNSTIDEAYSIIQTEDNCYIITGGIMDQNNNYNSDIFLLKIDMNGNIKWMKTYHAGNSEYGKFVQLTHDGGFLISGATMISGHYSAYIIKTDSTGFPQWNKIFNNIFTDAATTPESSVEDDFGNFYITGGTYYPYSGNDVFVVKFSSTGNILWAKKYGAVASSDYGYSVYKTYDGNIAVLAYTFGCSTIYSGSYLFKINSLGDTLWTKCYEFTYSDKPNRGILTNDDGFIITGNTNPYNEVDACLFKLDSLGNQLWYKTYGIVNTPNNNQSSGNSVVIGSDGGYIINGYTYSYANGKNSMYLIKTDKNGNSGCNEVSRNVIPFSIITVVSNINFNYSSNLTINNISVFSSSGSQINTICTSLSIEEPINKTFDNITISPNPSTDIINIQIPQQFLKTKTLEIFDCMGQLQLIKTEGFSEADISSLAKGLYFIVLTNGDNERLVSKIMKE
jgi:hypothetical protein